MHPKRYNLIIFDCDGTLVDSEAIHSRACSEVLVSLGYSQYTPEFCMKHFTGMSMPNLLTYLSQALKLPMPQEEIVKRFVERGGLLAHEHLQEIPHAHTLLAQLPHKKCVASNGERKSVLESLAITGLNVFFPEDHVFTHSQVKQGKPAPDLFLFAAAQMGVGPEECLVIEDSLTGIKAAKAAGMTVLGFTGASHPNLIPQEAMPDAMIGGLLEVLDYVSG